MELRARRQVRDISSFFRERPGLAFAVKYAAISGALLLVYFFPYERLGLKTQGLFEAYLSAYARLAGTVLHWTDSSVSVSNTVISGRYSLQIVKSCDAIEVKVLVAGAILALPSPLKQRLLFLVAALLLIVAANVSRISALYWIGILFPDWFEFAHLELFPLCLVIFAGLVFLAGAHRLQTRSSRE